MLEIIKEAKKILSIEAETVLSLIDRVDENFSDIVEELYNNKGKVVVTGIGKSGIIGRKIVATLSSTGTLAIFLHSSEALHGDLGIVCHNDIVIAISNSGETKEVLDVVSHLKRFNIKLISMTNPKSSLAQVSDHVLDISVEKEAFTLDVVPTSSTIATLAMGDALAGALMLKTSFKKEEFALIHPGGSLGKKYLKVSELMHTGKEIPLVYNNSLISEVVIEMSSKRLGTVVVCNSNNTAIVGIITDGDLRRKLQKYGVDLFSKIAEDVMTVNPKMIRKEEFAKKALFVMKSFSITSLVIFEKELLGIIHIHDLLHEGI